MNWKWSDFLLTSAPCSDRFPTLCVAEQMRWLMALCQWPLTPESFTSSWSSSWAASLQPEGNSSAVSSSPHLISSGNSKPVSVFQQEVFLFCRWKRFSARQRQRTHRCSASAFSRPDGWSRSGWCSDCNRSQACSSSFLHGFSAAARAQQGGAPEGGHHAVGHLGDLQALQQQLLDGATLAAQMEAALCSLNASQRLQQVRGHTDAKGELWCKIYFSCFYSAIWVFTASKNNSAVFGQ